MATGIATTAVSSAESLLVEFAISLSSLSASVLELASDLELLVPILFLLPIPISR